MESTILEAYSNSEFEVASIHSRELLKEQGKFPNRKLEKIFFLTESNLLVLDKYLENKIAKKEIVDIKPLLLLLEKVNLSDSTSIGKKWCEYLVQNKSENKLFSKGIVQCANLYYQSKDFAKARNLVESVKLEEIKNKSTKKQIIFLSIALSSTEGEFKEKLKEYSKKLSKPSDREKLLAIGKEFYQKDGNQKKYKKLNKWMKKEFPETYFQ